MQIKKVLQQPQTEAQKQLIIQHTIIWIMTVGMSAINQDY